MFLQQAGLALYLLAGVPLSLAVSTEFRALRAPMLTRADSSIDGLLNKRQTANCPAPGFTCQRNFCCQGRDYTCCSTGVCCWPDTYCSIGDDGNMGCCDNGSICRGSAGPPISSTVPNTNTRATPTSAPTNVGSGGGGGPSVTTPTVSGSRPTLLNSPLPTRGREMINVGPTERTVTYSPGHWTEVDSPCQPGLRAMRTTTARASFMFILEEGGKWGLDGYLNAHAVDASWEMYANGEMIWPFSTNTARQCSFEDFFVLPNMVSNSGLGQNTGPINFTVLVMPPGGSNNPFAPSSVSTMEFVFNELVLEKRKDLLGGGAMSLMKPSFPVIMGSVVTSILAYILYSF
ncbi:hypothetical protein CVT24_000107 [Panaeolus cyanescens]|uniref:GPI anchored protein n=1 Tax=Panaeolus cyanescens TaxID=181874 RepID=A0A409W7M0_9AGAR|nr:hypothetical protein CVT24_000107 [Panaeolus cyanescens]